MQKAQRTRRPTGTVPGGKPDLSTAIILKNVPPGYEWGWYSRQEPRMHLQSVDDKHDQVYKVWLEKDSKRVFEPAQPIPKKVLDRLEKAVIANRSHLEARWVRMMIAQGWIRLKVAGPLITLTIYPNYPTRFIRTLDLAELFPGIYDPTYPMTPKHFFLPPIIWRD